MGVMICMCVFNLTYLIGTEMENPKTKDKAENHEVPAPRLSQCVSGIITTVQPNYAHAIQLKQKNEVHDKFLKRNL